MELVPESLGGAVVFNVMNSCGANKMVCGNCADFSVAVHNWLVNTEVRYVLLDLQDEKEICSSFLEEMLQLAKRLKVPFVFAGVMEKPKKLLEAYDFLSKAPLFVTPDEALVWLNKNYPGLTKVSLQGLHFGVAIAQSRPRNAIAVEGEGVEPEPVD